MEKVPNQENRTPEPFSHHDETIHSIDLPEHKALAAPAVRRIAKEHKVALSDVRGSGKGGRILKEDILEYLEGRTSKGESPVVETASSRPKDRSDDGDKTLAITGIKRAMAKAMAESHSIPSFGYCDELDVTKLVALRKEIKSQLAKDGVNITYMPFFIKALSNSLNSFPELNAHVDAKCENMMIRSDHNIGLAVDTSHGLLVPNIKQVQIKSVMEISAELSKLMQKSKDRTLTVQDLSGGTITISNIGIVGGTYVRPLINPPEVAIVGIGRFRKRPVFDSEDKIVAAHTCNASWSADHRVIDGATLARFSELWKQYIENPLKLLLDS